MKYIVHTRFRGKAICGDVNLPALTECECDGVVIKYNDKPICFVSSENAHQYFAIDEDGMGMERGNLTQEIQTILAKRDDAHQARWDKIWGNLGFHKYKRSDYDDYWLWNHDFFNAPIKDLRHILDVIKGV